MFRRDPPPTSQATPPADIGESAAESSQAPALVLRLNRLEEELRQANGRIEELENHERLLEEQLQRVRQDVEYRSGAHMGVVTAPPPGAVAEAPEALPAPAIEGPAPLKPRKSDAFNPDVNPNAPGAPQPLGATVPSAPIARPLPAPASPATPVGAPLELGRTPAPAAPAPSGPLLTGSGVAMIDQPREQFNSALQAFQTGQYQQAEEGFKAFMAANPSHKLTPDAVFYIGETYFQRSRPREAAEQYLKVTTDYSKSNRAPESMVRLGQTLAALGNPQEACATFAEFGKRYPSATPSVKRLAEREMAKDHCD
ncbi:MAG: tol-pal system protein YbgF [Hyphomicrobiales bacterium]|nr:tol-pal system protein YbgF [Hyphomicrobiales bacterium]